MGMRRLPFIVLVTILAAACGEERKSYVPNVGDGNSTPTMTTLDVNTFISDSTETVSVPLIWKSFIASC